MRDLDDITGAIVDASVQIHRKLGPGLLESVYAIVLARELERRGFRVERQKAVPIEYDGVIFEEGFRADLVVENRRRPPPDRQRSPSLRVSAPPREPSLPLR